MLENYDLPRVEADFKLRAELNKRDKEDLLEEIKTLDKSSYTRLKDADKRRIVRALEVMKILGKPFSEVSTLKEPEYNVEWICPKMESREWLYDRINKRVDIMIENGLIDEVKAILKKYDTFPTAMQGLRL